MATRKIPITFITGNAKKLEEFLAIMTGQLADSYSISNLGMDLLEIQGTPDEIAKYKAKLAATKTNTPVLIEDVSLCFNAYKGLPGPYIKDFLTSVGREGLWKMVQNYDDKTAYAQCTFAFCEGPDAEPITFVGRCNGQIVAPRGENMFGWDPVFQPDGFETTFAEMEQSVKNGISHRGNALALVR
mmetsp:Transcript_3604/g.4615  ORF Transcript_3604/g.4615 Transcript_3604/m.4615 type:complete len:186 (+) Transcript_3604:138-695(+)|eukprot:CAMPEP_0170467550 /NCGR_PEP_ID=MMETSP0123-20130129/11089_1 /TAXON_ID=182087 /ORGANISM="Favella ehrenbergii, Strain Fehren 1" /LENGTH=185 /DNA_ID=CAMNT_0010733949 /DNA_START=75 /DNA_END=632 /DNA_ORIENTATION=+